MGTSADASMRRSVHGRGGEGVPGRARGCAQQLKLHATTEILPPHPQVPGPLAEPASASRGLCLRSGLVGLQAAPGLRSKP